MKNVKPLFWLNCFLFSALASVQLACSNARLTPIEDEKAFLEEGSMKIFDELKSEVQKFIINEESEIPIRTPNGTSIWIYPDRLVTVDGEEVNYPFEVEVIELYSFKDMILHQKPTESFGQMLVTGGALYLGARKEGESLVVKQPYIVTVPSGDNVDPFMDLFYGGIERKGRFTWALAETPNKGETNQVFNDQEGYSLFPDRLGWINVDRFLKEDESRELTQVKFTSDTPSLDNIMVYMVFPDINSVISVYQGLSLEVPIGEKVILVALAETESGGVYSFFKDFLVEKDMSVKIAVEPSSKEEVVKRLELLGTF